MIKIAILLSVLLTSICAFACTVDGSEGIVPENDMWIGANSKSVITIDEAEFNRVIDKVVEVYKPIISQAGGKLKVERKWSDGTVNAYAKRSWGSWQISMFGGLARHEAITSDGFALVVCHELGHHMGGAPKKTRNAGRNGTVKRWATNEGQADYWATLKCLRKTWYGEDHGAALADLEIPQTVKDKCEAQFTNKEEKFLCQRSSMAGLSVSLLFQALRSADTAPDFDTPDTNIVSKHYHSHPHYQCRLDTYFNGALCAVSDVIDVDQEDMLAGNCNRIDGERVGVRPLCWFKPE